MLTRKTGPNFEALRSPAGVGFSHHAPTRSQLPAGERYAALANRFGGSSLSLGKGVPEDVVTEALDAILSVCDSLGDPDFDGAVAEMNKREKAAGRTGGLSISIIDLGLLGDVRMRPSGEHGSAKTHLEVVLNVTSIICPHKVDITQQVREALRGELGDGFEIEVHDQYEDFIRTFFPRVGLGEDIPTYVELYRAADKNEVIELIDELGKIVLNEVKERGDFASCEEVLLHMHGRWSRLRTINPASIPESRIDHFERFVELATLHPNIPFLAGGHIRAVPIVNHARPYYEAARRGDFGEPGTPSHAEKASDFIEEREAQRIEAARARRAHGG